MRKFTVIYWYVYIYIICMKGTVEKGLTQKMEKIELYCRFNLLLKYVMNIQNI